MEIWSLWLIVITSFLSLSLLLSFYFITKSRHHAEAQVIEKAMKQNEQIQHSISMTTGNFMKKPPHQMQRDLSESFIDLGKDHSAVAIASTTNILDKSRVRVMGDLIPKSDRDRDRSIDLLLANSGRNGHKKKRKSISHPNSIEFDAQIIPKKNPETEKLQLTLKQEIFQIEKEIASQSRFSLFRTQIGKEFVNQHYLVALMVPNRQKRPFRYHIMLNSSFYVILLFGLSFLVPEFGINYLEDFNSLIFSGVYLVLLIPFLIFSYKNIEDDKTLSVKLTYNKQTVQGEDPLEDRIFGIISSAQKEFYKDIIAKLFVIIGLSGGLVTLSRVPKLDILLTKPLLLGFLLLVAFDVLVVRNIMIMAVAITFKSQLQQAILHERVIELMKTKPQPTAVSCTNEGVTKLFTVQQDLKENAPNSDISLTQHNILVDSFIPKESHLLEATRINDKSKIEKNIVLTTEGNNSSELDNIDCFRNRLTSFSEKEGRNSIITQKQNDGVKSTNSLHGQEEIASTKRNNRLEQKSNTKENEKTPEKPVKVSLKETFRNKFKDFEINKAKEEKDFVLGFTPRDENKNRSSEKKKKHESSYKKKDLRGVTSVEILMDLEGALTNRSESKNIRNKKESPSKHEIHDTRTELQLPLSQERDIGSNTQDAAPDVIKIKSLIYPTQENWADSLLGERRKDDCVLPNLGAKKSSFLTSQTGTTMNSIRDYDSHKSHNRSQICLDQNKRGRTLQLDGPDSYPPSFAYLEQHDKSSQVGLKLSEYASAMTSRHSVGADSQCEIKNDLESLVKYLTKGDKNNDVKTDSEIGDFEGNTFECRLSTHEAHGRSAGLRSLQESGFVLKERKNQQSKEDDVRILRERSNSQSKKSPWLGGYDISLHQYQPQYQPNRRVLPHSDSSKSRIKYQEIGKMTINKMGQSKEMLGYGMNVEKMSEVSKSYGYRMQHNGPTSKEREISFDKIKTRKSSSVEKPKEDLEGSSRPPRASVIGYEQRNLENKRVIRSLNQVPNLPKARTSSKSQVFM